MKPPPSSSADDGSGSIAILGGGVSGRSVADLLRSRGKPAVVFDERGGERGRSEFRPVPGEYALAVVSPGFRPGHPWRRVAREAGIPLSGETEFAASLWPGRLLCVTGTNGKTTLTRFLERALQANGEEARACGNIGLPLSALCGESASAQEIAVCEISSFQLYDWANPRCEVAFWINFAPDHLDWHQTEGDYFAAKWRLATGGSSLFAEQSVCDRARAMGLPLPETIHPVDCGRSDSDAAEGLFARPPFRSLYALAAAWWRSTGRPIEVLAGAARDFEPLPHRMEALGTVDGLAFVNDSKATNFHAAVAAVRSLPGRIRWIGGGSDKGEDPSVLASELAKCISSADTFGGTGECMAGSIRSTGLPVGCHDCLAAAFEAAVVRARPGDTVLLSPGFASFDQFSGYEERGNAFRALVRNFALSTTTKNR